MPLKRNARSKDVWWCRFWIHGREFYRSTGEADRRRAKAAERRIRAEEEARVASVGPRDRKAVTMKTLAALDLARAESEGAGNKQRDALEYLWSRIRAHFGDERDTRTLTPGELAEYVRARRAAVTGQTIKREVQAIRRAMRVAETERMMRPPLLASDWPRVRLDAPSDKQRGKYHPPEVLASWLAHMDEGARDAATFTLLTGLRAKEVARVTAQWVEPVPVGTAAAPGVVAVLRLPASSTKNRKGRVVGLTAESVEIIRRRLEANPERELVFGDVLHRRAFETARRRIGYPRTITLRDLRHTHATIGASVSVHGTRDALGHGRLSMTDRYVTARLEDVSRVSSAVAAALTGALTPEHSPENALYGGRRGDRTPDILRVNPEQADHDHLNACNYCREHVRGHRFSQVVALPDRSTRPEHSAQAKPRRGSR